MTSVKNLVFAVAIVVAIVVVAALLPAQISAQDDARTYIQVRSSKVKGGMVPEYLELQKQFTEAMKADDRDGRNVWQEIRGDLGTFHSVTSVDNFGDFDTPFEPPMDEEAWSEWIAAITNVIDSSTLTIIRTHPELATASGDGREPNLLYLRFRTVGPGMVDDYMDWIADELSPALKKGGADVTFSRVVLGGNNRTFISGSYLDNWAQMDAPGPLAHMSEEEIDAMLGRANDMVVESENRLLRYRDDLSY